MDVVEIKRQMEVGRVRCQQIEEDLFDFCGAKRAEGFEELCGKRRIKDIGVDVLLKESEEILEPVAALGVMISDN
jgi:hypothetical protein